MPLLPMAVSADDVREAANIIKAAAHRTPVLTSTQANALTGASLFFKCENYQRIGAFKFRGAYNAISHLTPEQKKNGVVAFSSGNHAQAMALAARELNVPVTIVMPHDAPAAKLAATRGYGAEVIIYNRQTEDREAIAADLAAKRGLSIIPPYNHPHVIAGQGTSALELFEEVGELDFLFVCTGGGGLLSGCAIAAKHMAPNCRIFGVEPEAGNDVQQSLRTGERVSIAVPNTIADGAQTQCVGELTFPIIRNFVEDILTVSDQQLCDQMRFFMERMKIVVEPTGCLAAAAAMSGAIDIRGARVGIIVSGGNVDAESYADFLKRGNNIL
ncbi:threo-3-hydroxy-L-aspartate ammonia-lyase [Hafnia alvei]|uniref:threo-3-hydroxy-L-aspartate ammonia-lyase n=1 Tax=Hafnia alvei TaxID=569 RepID=UPI00061D0E3E|nr:threo-3-hydroxy-L-aspartate ammonia-lyase [Hafnia alvei]KID00873.2 serine dehydratase [Hafnia alvei]MBW3475622.1 threo-3-hydroxy-L-aspartate ammonia-lyase [Hafnia alvei]MDU3155955.1 threo-3-hydroxy-L-aspartate ammonia-lyase [Hafnia alvei]TBL42593.1 threo-3-hydroxy-L-aspartate ammonia-lyase [Hafnia alvei]TBM12874.1 threo-3-hydroxy-L-aspartate ammonia-lyase [Hafnia alvei]